MQNYYEAMEQNVFDNLPLTFHIKNGLDDPQFHRFKQFYFKCEDDIKNKKAQQRQKRREAQEKKDDEEDKSPQPSPDKKKSDEPKEPVYYQS